MIVMEIVELGVYANVSVSVMNSKPSARIDRQLM